PWWMIGFPTTPVTSVRFGGMNGAQLLTAGVGRSFPFHRPVTNSRRRRPSPTRLGFFWSVLPL
ncbi:MAG TPA: hypothetical protein VN609_00110, partial [Propionibacteriaceae bacterium]|nr:hypothetical protein [Propionibacteriaceae bacterium]